MLSVVGGFTSVCPSWRSGSTRSPSFSLSGTQEVLWLPWPHWAGEASCSGGGRRSSFCFCFGCRAAVASDLHPLAVCFWRWWWCKSRNKRDLSTLTSVPPDAQRALTLQSASLWLWSSSAAGGRSAGCARVAPPITSCQMFNKTWTILNGVLQTVSAPVCRVGTLQ